MGILSLFRRRTSPAASPRADVAAPTATPQSGATARAPSSRAPTVSVLLHPTITEKAARRQQDGWYTFHVHPTATKPDIRRAVERQFRVHVERVSVLTLPGKERRRGSVVGRVPGHRKALVRLREGERITTLMPEHAHA